VADLSVPPDLVAIGEVGLAGEIRRVTGIQRRLIEAERMGFRRALIPAGSAVGADGAQSGSGRAGRGGRADRAARAGSNGRSGQAAYLHLADPPRSAGSQLAGAQLAGAQLAGALLAGSQLEVTEVADMQSAIAVALGRR
jgi:hypothetical protein